MPIPVYLTTSARFSACVLGVGGGKAAFNGSSASLKFTPGAIDFSLSVTPGAMAWKIVSNAALPA